MLLFRHWWSGVAAMVLGLLLSILAPYALAQPSIGLIYQKPDSPSAGLVLDEIIAGLREAAASGPLQSLEINESGTAKLTEWLAQAQPQTVIALGHTRQLLPGKPPTMRIVSGALDLSATTTPNALGVSLAVDPALFFDYLRKLLPRTRRVFVVHEPKDRWLIDLAKQAAAERDLTLQAFEADNYSSGAQSYRKIVESIEPERDAIWLPINDQRLDRTQVLPWLIEESWVRRFALLTNSLDDVRLGATFGLYPDPKAYGKRLWELATGSARAGVEPARAVRSAIQLRFAKHLDANIGAIHIDATFPVE